MTFFIAAWQHVILVKKMIVKIAGCLFFLGANTQATVQGSHCRLYICISCRNTQLVRHMQDRVQTSDPLSGRGGHVLQSEGATSLFLGSEFWVYF